MSSEILGMLKLLGGFGLVMGFCLYQINSLKRDRIRTERERERETSTARDTVPEKQDS